MSTKEKVSGLPGLLSIRRELAARRREEDARAAKAARDQALREREQNLFRLAVGQVVSLPVNAVNRRETTDAKPKPAAYPAQREADEREVLLESLSDDFDVETLVETDDQLSFRQPGIGPDVVRKLRRGVWRIQREIDLHGLRREEARAALSGFLRSALRDGLRCVRVVHGKGLGSPGKSPVLKGRVQAWLAQKDSVLAFTQARPAEGGAGALVVLLQSAAPPGGR